MLLLEEEFPLAHIQIVKWASMILYYLPRKISVIKFLCFNPQSNKNPSISVYRYRQFSKRIKSAKWSSLSIFPKGKDMTI